MERDTWIKENWPTALAGGGALLAFIATFLTAARAWIVSVSYIDTDDGKLVLAFVLLASGLLVGNIFKSHLAWLIGVLLSGLVVAGTAAYDMVNISQLAADSEGLASAGPAPFLALLGGLALSIGAGFMGYRQRGRVLTQGDEQ